MPSKSPAQARLMAAVANNPQFAAKVGIPQSVGAEFHAADKARGMGQRPLNRLFKAVETGRNSQR